MCGQRSVSVSGPKTWTALLHESPTPAHRARERHMGGCCYVGSPLHGMPAPDSAIRASTASRLTRHVNCRCGVAEFRGAISLEWRSGEVGIQLDTHFCRGQRALNGRSDPAPPHQSVVNPSSRCGAQERRHSKGQTARNPVIPTAPETRPTTFAT